MLTSKHGSARPATNTELVHAFESSKAIVGIDTRLSSLIQLISEDVQHEFTVTLGIDMPVCFVVKSLAQCGSVDEVAVMGHGNTVWAVHVERLRL
jgi:hypothetical protein